jgi:tetratricopeptide (TPR) repeat protein
MSTTPGRVVRALLLGIVLGVGGPSACAPKIVPTPVVTAPRFPEFVRPAVPAAFENTASAVNENRGWAFLQSGDLKMAAREFAAAMRNDPAFFPAEASLGYVELARKDAAAALPHFDRALEGRRGEPEALSALVGRAQALLALNREDDALAAFESVLALDPSQIDIRRRVDVMKFRVSEQEIARARESARSGSPESLEKAVQAYTIAIASSPDSQFLYRERAGVERQRGNADAALRDFQKAVSLDPTDARSLAQIGEILEQRNELTAAEEAYVASLAIEPRNDLEKRLEALRGKIALEKLPAEYRAIEQAPQITRADLAALIGIRLSPLLQSTPRIDAGLITDVRTSWAAVWIMAVARAGVMEPFANHAFQPRAVVRRADLAQAAAHLLARVAVDRPDVGRRWESARPVFTDLPPGHLAYPAASAAVASGVMKTSPDNGFQPSRAVSGAEAVEVIARIQSLSGVK